MSDISKITTPDGTTYNIKDASARTALNGHTVGTNVPSNAVFSDTTYTISILNNVITLTSSTGGTSTATLPVYNGGVT